MSNIQIVASVLVRDENIFIERVIRNILEFCDKIIIADHQSVDGTYEICERLAKEFPKIKLKRIQSLGESFSLIKPYCNTPTWIFAVDGDEIFDPVGLQKMRSRLLSGEFSDSWNIFANTLHCTKLDLQIMKAWGHLAPPARAGARLYNFSIIDDWQDYGERLLGNKIVFKAGYHIGLRRYLHKELDWDTSCFRYVHTSFLPRSSMDKISLLKTRLNANEVEFISSQKKPLRKVYLGWKMQFLRLLGRDWKNQKYRRGPVEQKDISVFFSN